VDSAGRDNLWQANRVRLRTLPRRNQKVQLPREVQHMFNAVRQLIETVNGQLIKALAFPI